MPSYYQATRAADDVTVVGGVTGIDNQLLVGLLGETMNDADITVASAAALDAEVEASRAEVGQLSHVLSSADLRPAQSLKERLAQAVQKGRTMIAEILPA